MKHHFTDLFYVLLITVVSVAIIFVIPVDSVAGRIWTLPFILLIPGYALTAALLPGQLPGLVERFIFSLAVSLIIIIVGALVLNWTPFGLNARSWAVFLAGISLISSGIAFLRRRRLNIPFSGLAGFRRIPITLPQGVLCSFAALIVCTAIGVSVIGAQQQPSPGFTELWILPHGEASNHSTVQLGVKNMEATPMEYRLVVDMNGKITKVWPTINLNQNSTWQSTFSLQLDSQSTPTKVEAILYRIDAPSKVYRHVLLWLN